MRKAVFVLLILAGLCYQAHSQKVTDVIDRYRAKIGPMINASAEHSAFFDYYMEGDACYDKICFPARFYIKAPKTMRMEFTFQNLQFYMITNDSLKWEYNPLSNTHKVVKTSAQAEEENDTKTLDFANEDLYHYKDRKHKVKIVGKEMLDSLECFVIELINADKEKTTYHLNTTTHLIHRIEDAKRISQFYDYSAYVGKLYFPRVLIEKRDGKTMEMRFSKILFSQKFPTEMFIVPDSAKNNVSVAGEELQQLMKRAEEFSEQAMYDSAIGTYNRIVKQANESEGIYNLRGLAYLNKGDYYAAIADFSRAMEINPGNEVLYYNRGLAKYNLNDYDNALKDYNASLQLKPDFMLAYEQRGLLYYRREMYNEAIADFTSIIDNDPVSGANYFNRGASLAELEKYDEALADYKKSFQTGYNTADLNNYTGVSYYRLEQYDTALVYFEKAWNMKQDLQYMENLARTSYALGDYEKAGERFAMIRNEVPDNASIVNMAGLCQYFQENHKQAIQLFNEAIKLNPKEAVYYDNRAAAKEAIDDFQGAIEDYSESIKLYPNDASVFYKRGILKILTSKKIEGCLDLGTANEMEYSEAKEAILKHCN